MLGIVQSTRHYSELTIRFMTQTQKLRRSLLSSSSHYRDYHRGFLWWQFLLVVSSSSPRWNYPPSQISAFSVSSAPFRARGNLRTHRGETDFCCPAMPSAGAFLSRSLRRSPRFLCEESRSLQMKSVDEEEEVHNLAKIEDQIDHVAEMATTERNDTMDAILSTPSTKRMEPCHNEIESLQTPNKRARKKLVSSTTSSTRDQLIPTPVTPEPTLRKSTKTRKSQERDKTGAGSSHRETKTSRRKAKPAGKKKTTNLATWEAPIGWEETYDLVRELRKDKTAPCDEAGAEALVLPPPENCNPEEYARVSRFQTLIALMLSSQTKDAMVGQAMKNLRETNGGLTVASMLEIDPKLLNKKIYSVGFRNNKTKYIKQVAQILRDKYEDDVPPTAAEMIRDLPGVGPKMAYIVENICWDHQTGIGVDTHMHRLFPQIGWVSPDTKNPEQTRKQLESWLPREYWGEVNLLWVGFGQEVQQEKQKSLQKALTSSRPMEALKLLRSIDFDVDKEWDKMLSTDAVLWKDERQKEGLLKMIEESRQ